MPFSFDSVDASAYDELRPGYAPEAVAWVARRGHVERGSLVVDLAAGTGQLARAFASLGGRVVAVEPAANMRAVIEANLPSVRATAGTAEGIPLDDGAADVVVVGNAFHHFDDDRAFAELRRVLRRDGALALFWARHDGSEHALDAIDAEVDHVVAGHRASASIARTYRAWGAPPAIDGFTPLERRTFPVPHVVASTRLADLYATSSHVASLPAPTRAELLDRIRALASVLPETIELAGRSDLQLCFRT